jgi:hypothetical protein
MQRRVFAQLAVSIGVLWVALIGVLMWLHARQSIEPPLYDAYGYFLKARNVWAGFHHGRFHDLLNSEPSLRPPGTVLMSYPFGFSLDFRAFYFRSVFLPIALIFAAVVAAISVRSAAWQQPQRVVLLATFFCAAPFFYFFEPTVETQLGVTFWGLVDGFLTGLASLAAGLCLRSIDRRSVTSGLGAVAVLVLMIFVKPSGALLAALGDMVLFSGWMLVLWHERRGPQQAALIRRAGLILGTAAAASLAGVVLAVHSNYLGGSNVSYGKESLEVLRSESPLTLDSMTLLLRSGIGPLLALWLLVLTPFALAGVCKGRTTSASSMGRLQMPMAFCVILVGAGFWYFLAGGSSQIRYFMPFCYFGLVLAADAWLEAWAALPAWAGRSIGLLMLASVSNATLLLLVPHPSLPWQRLTGSNVAAGRVPPGINQAKALIAELAGNNAAAHTVSVYSIDVGLSDAVFDDVLFIHQLDQPVATFELRRPIDWQRASVYRLKEITSANYLLFVPLVDAPARSDPRQLLADTLQDEEYRFRLWATGLGESDGVIPVSVSENASLLKVTDPIKLSHSLDAMVASYHWRDLFLAENPPLWWSPRSAASAAATAAVHVNQVRFGSQFMVAEATLARQPDHKLRLAVWLAPLDQTQAGWHMFVHEIDQQGRILVNLDQPLEDFLSRPDPEALLYLHQALTPPPATVAVAIGFYRGSILLSADRGARDWTNRRVLLSLPP